MTSNGTRSVIESLTGKHVLVTGVTGFLGKVWLAMLLHQVPSIRRVTVLVRAKKGQSATQRFEEIATTSPALRALRDAVGSGIYALVREKVRVLEGDCGEPFCGLDADGRDACRGVDLVVHFAGLTDFEPDPPLGIAANIDGASHAADLAALTRGRRLLHVSTTFVAGRVSGRVPEELRRGVSPRGKSFDVEAEIAGLKAAMAALGTKPERAAAAGERAEALGWPNIYTYTKGLAEHLLERRTDVRVTIVRPAIVESAHSYPFAGWNEGINTSGPLVWLFSTTFRHFPSRPRNHFEVVPVDTVARSMIVIAADALLDRAHDVYQLASADANPVSIGRASELTNLAVRRMYKRKGSSAFERWVVRHCDVVPVEAGARPFLGVHNLRRAAQKARDLLRQVDLARELPPTLYAKHGERLEEKRKSVSMQLRNADRQLGRVEEMLRLYQPFIFDHDIVFETARIRVASAALSPADQERFGFDIETLDWRSYWLDVHVPGLETWCLPLLAGEDVPVDQAPPRPPEPSPPRGHGEPMSEQVTL